MTPITPAPHIKPTGPINAVSTDNTPAVSGSSLTSITEALPGSATGVVGSSGSGVGVAGISSSNDAIHGLSHSSQHAGVSANNDAGGFGLWARATTAGYFLGNVQVTGDNVNDAFNSLSHSPQHAGVSANNDAGGFGLWAKATIAGHFEGNVQVNGDNLNDAFNSLSHSPQHAGVSANNDAGGFGLWAKATTAGYFDGNVQVTGTLTVAEDIILEGADCAEEFDLHAALELDPGTVVVLDSDGALEPSSQSYDRKVAGVISGGGDFRPGMILDRRESSRRRAAIALMGKVFCKVDSQYGPVEVGDLLTTSPTPGHAMKASDSSRAFGAVIGKAMRPLSSGRGLLPILIALQ